jgi:hypothetical protein
MKGMVIIFFLSYFSSCSQTNDGDAAEQKKQSRHTPTLFQKLSPQETGITFSNTISTSPEFNKLLYPLIYNGGGVATGDINNDGLIDIFLTGNMESSRLYLNKGDFQFKDITELAGVATDRWITGVSMIDIDNNGYTDIYLSVVSEEDAPVRERTNLLFINNGDATFIEAAENYNIADTSFTTHAAFLDYNRDDLPDLFLLNHSPGTFSRTMGLEERRPAGKDLSTSFDKLYKNNGDGTFTDVSREAGILEKTGFGLGVAVGDVNRDGWPDLYVSNDLLPNDVLYINNGDGTFSDKADEYLKHTSFAGMGVDIADFNNDGWPDIMQADMMPPDYNDQKLMNGGISYEYFENRLSQGYAYSYTMNTLQMSNGVKSDGGIIFSEIARMAGVAYTGWSWAALFGDYDNNGYKDIMITNGFPKAVNDFDYLVEKATSDSDETEKEKREREYRLLQELHEIKLPNYLFRNEGDLVFSDVSEAWGFTDSTFSYGAAHADLDNDGALDLVINNINAPVSVYKNRSRERIGNHYLTVALEGSELNRQGLGAKVVLTAGDLKQHAYQSPYRGYQSSVDPRLHFGLGDHSRLDSLEVFWPDGRYQVLEGVGADRQLSVNYADAIGSDDTKSREETLFTEVTSEAGLQYEHRENRFNDYKIQPLLHQQLSKTGPKLAVGDVTGNGLDDIYIGGAADYPGMLYVQDGKGRFEEFNENQPWINDRLHEDTGACFFDANGDDLVDLYVASGGYEFSLAENAMLDRLYINNGGGRFYKAESALPRIYGSSSVVKAGDFNRDGRPDLFVGGRLIPYKYPHGAKSYILQNEGGTFRDVTSEVAPDMLESGLVTDAMWVDFNEDGQLDLVTAGIWQPVRFFKNRGDQFTEVTKSVVESPQRGWWYSLEKGDFNGDGAIDIVAGNLGLNHNFTTSEEKKFEVFANDFNKDLTTDIIYAVEERGSHYPFFGSAKLGRRLPFIDEKYETYKAFSGVSMQEIFGPGALDESLHYQADTFASTLFQNKGGGTFTQRPLAELAQISPIQGMVSHDMDADGIPDLLAAGNLYAVHPDIARADAGNGVWLKGKGEGGFEPISPIESGFLAPGDVKDLQIITTPYGKAVLVAKNSGKLQLFRIL